MFIASIVLMCQEYSSIYEIYEYVSYMAQYHLRKHKISLRTVQKRLIRFDLTDI